MAFMFGGNSGKTYEDIQRKRRMAESMAAQMGTPRNVGEGLSAIGKALAVRGLNKQADKGEDKLRGNVNDAWAGISQALGRRQGGMGGGGTPGFNPGASSPVNVPDRNSPEGIGDDAMAALGTPQFTPGDRESFTSAIMPYARQAAEQTGLDPRLIVAQAAQETGWGKSVPNGNLFGIKSHGKPGGARLSTQEYRNGQMGKEQASFRQYDDIGQSVQDYAAFLQENPRYRQMLEAGDLDSQVAALGQSGYATDPNYAQSVGSIARSIQVPGMEQMPQGQGQQPQGQPQQGGGISIDQLAMVAGSPVASDAQRMIAQTLLQRQLAQPDPMRDLQMQKAQLEIERMRNPQETRLITGEEAQRMGLPDGAYNMKPDGSVSAIGGGGVTVNNRTDPAPASGYRNVYDDAGRLVSQEPIPGGPAERKIAEEQAAAQEAEREAQRAAENQAQNEGTRSSVVQQTTSEIRNLLDQGGTFNLPEVGVIGSRLTGVNQEAADMAGMLDTLKGMVAFDRLDKLRQASATGSSGLGQVTEREISLLAAQLGALDQTLSPDRIRTTLDTVENVFGKLSPGAQQYLMGQQDNLPQGDGAATLPASSAPKRLRFNPETGELE